jgi:formylglycine-generating enzyme
MVMAFIPSGTFLMGSPATEEKRFEDEPQFPVTIPRGFYMGKHQVTQELYQSVMGKNPSRFINFPEDGEEQAKRPVEQVSWFDALVFCNKLSLRHGLMPVYSIKGSTDPADWGKVPAGTWNATTCQYDITGDVAAWAAVAVNDRANGYRLPTEAEWEYACRAGTTTAYNTGEEINHDSKWYAGNSGSKTHEVCRKMPNDWGLHDMHGNVWEWCWDGYNGYADMAADTKGMNGGLYRAARGGGWYDLAQFVRSACRAGTYPWDAHSNLGFRLVRSEFCPCCMMRLSPNGRNGVYTEVLPKAA